MMATLRFLRPALALVALALCVLVLSPRVTPKADAQVAIWTSCRNICMRSCQWEKGVMTLPSSDSRITTVGNQCWEIAECKKLHGYFAPNDPKIDRDGVTAAIRLGQCKQCAAQGREGRCPESIFGSLSTSVGGLGGRSYGGGIYGGGIYGGGGYGGASDPARAFARCFEQTVRERIAEGYYVKNYSFIRHVRTAAAALNPFLDKSRGGRCGEYGEWGMKWIKPCVDRHVPGAIVDDLIVEEKSSAHKKHWRDTLDSMYEANHRATRVVLPDGRRFVVDYWQGVGSGQPALMPQSQWVRLWKERIGSSDSVLTYSDDEMNLKKAVDRLGEEKGFALFRKQNKGLKNVNPELWIQSWKRESW
jgi:hypothetical protein